MSYKLGVDILQVKSNLKFFVLIEMSKGRNNFINNISNELYQCALNEFKNNNNNIVELYVNQVLI